MAEETSIWEIRLGMHTTRQQAEEIKERIERMLCPDPGHAPPCPIPWSISLLPEDPEDGEAYPELVEQARLEGERNS
ncbi:hypothetical protein ACFWY9_07955 [Amycolatopsis sp. NPDC059027]|uniref:hypothetical protein n=1 Tax=unclassified Amycolatopsis TaxID=2618356 RepID=UPI00366BB399